MNSAHDDAPLASSHALTKLRDENQPTADEILEMVIGVIAERRYALATAEMLNVLRLSQIDHAATCRQILDTLFEFEITDGDKRDV